MGTGAMVGVVRSRVFLLPGLRAIL